MIKKWGCSFSKVSFACASLGINMPLSGARFKGNTP
jgi:hypothetical protein